MLRSLIWWKSFLKPWYKKLHIKSTLNYYLPLSLKRENMNFWLSVILSVCNTIGSRWYLQRHLCFCNGLLYVNTFWPKEGPNWFWNKKKPKTKVLNFHIRSVCNTFVSLRKLYSVNVKGSCKISCNIFFKKLYIVKWK